uniref:Fibrinogen C-terminal domain-containing protein n=1 Tax=Macrostomum lignano TaxID=282301 RepID=A0A1I8FMB3_9PLAT
LLMAAAATDCMQLSISPLRRPETSSERETIIGGGRAPRSQQRLRLTAWLPRSATRAVQLVAFNGQFPAGAHRFRCCRLGLSHCRKCRNADKGAQRVWRLWFFRQQPTKCWTTVQRRVSDSVDFYRNWSQYQTGFGDGPMANYWIETRNFVTSSKIMTLNIASLPVGLNTLHALTQSRSRKLLILMRQWDDSQDWAEYSSFSVGSESDNYRLTVSDGIGDSLDGYSNNQQFTTFDADHDARAGSNCAKRFIGAWWYKSCFESHLNGPYKNYSEAIGGPFAIGIIWRYNYGFHYSLRSGATWHRVINQATVKHREYNVRV